MKRTICFLCLILICVTSIKLIASAEEGNKSFSWYCIRTKDHSRPPMAHEFNFISKYDGYYLGKDEKVIYLTFDVGYENGNVEKTLDILKFHNVPSAFFILSNIVDQNPELVKRMSDEGHLICNHTSKHPNMTKITDKARFKNELESLENFCYEKTELNISKYFRPPEGCFNEKTLQFAKELGYKTVFWSIAYADWDNNNQMSQEKAKDKILSNIHNGAIILLHPTSNTNVEILGDIITKLKNQGYRFGTLDELQ